MNAHSKWWWFERTIEKKFPFSSKFFFSKSSLAWHHRSRLEAEEWKEEEVEEEKWIPINKRSFPFPSYSRARVMWETTAGKSRTRLFSKLFFRFFFFFSTSLASRTFSFFIFFLSLSVSLSLSLSFFSSFHIDKELKEISLILEEEIPSHVSHKAQSRERNESI